MGWYFDLLNALPLSLAAVWLGEFIACDGYGTLPECADGYARPTVRRRARESLRRL